VKGDTLSYEDAGKKRTLRLKFGPRQTVEATRTDDGGAGGKAHQGVYIAGQEYLCISLEGAGGSGPDFILILRKQTANQKPTRD
jgi:hypothetical protein